MEQLQLPDNRLAMTVRWALGHAQSAVKWRGEPMHDNIAYSIHVNLCLSLTRVMPLRLHSGGLTIIVINDLVFSGEKVQQS